MSLSNFFDSDNIGLRRSLSLSKKFDSDKERINPIFTTYFLDGANVELSRLIAGWKKNNIRTGKKDFDSDIVFILHQKGIP